MKNNVRILIVEDEFITLNNLRNSLGEMGYSVSGDAMKAEEAIAVLEKKETDIAILDINLKGEKTGIWLAEQIKQKYKIPFIFLSALSDPKTIEQAANTEPSSYLVKPFTTPDIYAAVEIAIKNFAKKKDSLQLPKSQGKVSGELLINDSIYVKDNLIFRKIKLKDVVYVQAFKNYLELRFNSDKHIIRSTLKDFYEILPNKYFVQTHRSFLVNIGQVEKIGSRFARVGDYDIPISDKYREKVLQRLKFFF